MKHALKQLMAFTIPIATAFAIHSQPLIQVTDIPNSGTFIGLSGANWPPVPFDPLPDANLYTDGTNFFYDDRGVSTGDFSFPSSGGAARTLEGPPFPGGGGGTYTPPVIPLFTQPGAGYTNCVTYTNFWLAPPVVSPNLVTVTITNTIPGLYYNLLQKPNLNAPSWTLLHTFLASGFSITTNISIATNTNTCFFQAALTNDSAPIIVQAPSNQVVGIGTNAVFQVAAVGLPPLGYQWYSNGVPIPGATSTNLTITAVKTNAAGPYSVVVSNAICESAATAYLGTTWTNALGNPIYSTPAIRSADGMIFVTTHGPNGQLVALDATGHPRWARPVTNDQFTPALDSSPTLSANGAILYVGDQQGNLFAIDIATQTNKWDAHLGGAGAIILSTPALSADGSMLYVTVGFGGTNGLFAVHSNDGSVAWVFVLDDAIAPYPAGGCNPAIGPDCTIYFTGQADLFAVNPDGSLKWIFPMLASSVISSSPAVDASGLIYVGDNIGFMYCISPIGTVEWVFDTGDQAAIESSPTLGPDSTVYFGSTDGNIFAVRDGVGLWTNSTGEEMVGSPAVASDGTVYIGSDGFNHTFYAITNGAVKWSVFTGGALLGSPTISESGAVVIGSGDGSSYCLAGSPAAPPPAESAWPMFHKNASHTGAIPNPVCSGQGGLSIFPNNINVSPGNVTFYFSGTPGASCTIYATSDFVQWIPVGFTTLGPGGTASMSDQSSTAGVGNRFYVAVSGDYCSDAIGYVNISLAPYASNLVANQLYGVSDLREPQNTLAGWDGLGLSSGVPAGSSVLTWTGERFAQSTLLFGGSWSPSADATLLPGEAFYLSNPSTNSATISFAGRAPRALLANPIDPGKNYVSCILPLAGRLTRDLNYVPTLGDTVAIGSSTYTNTGSGWLPSEPVLQVGQGFLLNASVANNWIQPMLGCPTMAPATWNYALSSSPIWASPILPGDGKTLYINFMASSDELLEISASSGSLLRSNSVFTTGSSQFAEFCGSPSYGSNAIYIATDGTTIRSLTTNFGLNWEFDLGQAACYSTPAISGHTGRLYIASDEANDSAGGPNAGLLCLSPINAASNWWFQPQDVHDSNKGDIDGNPAILANGDVVFLAEAMRFYCLSPSGAVKWFVPTPGDKEPDASPAIGSNGTIYFGGSRLLRALNPDGSTAWLFDTGIQGDTIRTSPAVTSNNIVIFGSHAGGLFAVTNGVQQWAFFNLTGGAFDYSSPALAQHSHVIIGGADGFVYCVSNGVVLWSAPTGAEIRSSPVLAPDGQKVYLANTAGHVIAIPANEPPDTNAPWPMFQHDAAHTGQQTPLAALDSDCSAPFLYDGTNDGPNRFTFCMVGPANTAWNVFTSSNLVSWTNIKNNLVLDAASGTNAFTDSTASNNVTQRFYRLGNGSCCSRVYGFVKVAIPQGANLIANPLCQVDDGLLDDNLLYAMNSLNGLFNNSFTAAQNGAQVLEWNGHSLDAFTFQSGPAWYDANTNQNYTATLLPGASALFNNPNSAVTNTFIGWIRTQQVFNVTANSTNYLSATVPTNGLLTTVTGYVPRTRDKVQLWTNSVVTTFTYTTNGWSRGAPSIGVGQGFVLISAAANSWTNSWNPACP